MLYDPAAAGLGTLLWEGDETFVFRAPDGSTAVLFLQASGPEQISEGVWKGSSFQRLGPIIEVLAALPLPLPDAEQRALLADLQGCPESGLLPENIFRTERGWSMGPLRSGGSWTADWLRTPPAGLQVWQQQRAFPGPASRIALAPDRKSLAWVQENRIATVSLEREDSPVAFHKGYFGDVAYSSRGELTAYSSHGPAVLRKDGWVQLASGWNTRMSTCLAYSPGGRLLAAVDGTVVVLMDSNTGAEVSRLPQAHWVHALAWRADGRQLATACEETVSLFDLPGGALLRQAEGCAPAVCFDARGEVLTGRSLQVVPAFAPVDLDPAVSPLVSDIAGETAWVTPGRLHLHGETVCAPGAKRLIAGAHLLVTGGDSVGVWARGAPTPRTGSSKYAPTPVPPQPVGRFQVAVSPEGLVARLQTGGFVELAGHRLDAPGGVEQIWFSPGGRYWLGRAGSTVRLFDCREDRLLTELAADASPTVGGDDRWLFTVDSGGVCLRSLPDLAVELRLMPHHAELRSRREAYANAPPGLCIDFAPIHLVAAMASDGSTLATYHRQCELWDTTGRRLGTAPLGDAGLALSGRFAAAHLYPDQLRICTVPDGAVLHTMACPQQYEFCPTRPEWLALLDPARRLYVRDLAQSRTVFEESGVNWFRWVGSRLLICTESRLQLL